MQIKICIDAGHGVNANRGVCTGYYESNGNFALANLVSEELEKSGFIVIKTKTNLQEDPSLEARGNMAKGCQLFLSLHSDAASNQNVSYVTAIRSIKRPDSYTLGALLAGNIETLMKKDLPDISLSKYAGAIDGVWTRKYPSKANTDYYSVIRNAAKYSECKDIFLLECGHHTNLATCNWLDSSSKRKELADVIVKTIKEYYNVADTDTDVNTDTDNGTFINNIIPIAKDVQATYNILASLSIAQAIVDTGYNSNVGDSSLSELVINTNNLFKITKDISNKKGDTYTQTINGIKTEYCKYESMKECFEDRAKIITENSKYLAIKNANNIDEGAIAAEDYGWVKSVNYAEEILSASAKFDLTKYDNIIQEKDLETRVSLLEKQVEELSKEVFDI